jgi:hypothetical protein
MSEFDRQVDSNFVGPQVQTELVDKVNLSDTGVVPVELHMIGKEIPVIPGIPGSEIEADLKLKIPVSDVSKVGVDPIAPRVEERIEDWENWMPLELKQKKPTKKQEQQKKRDEGKLRRWETNVNLLRNHFNDHEVLKLPKSKQKQQ